MTGIEKITERILADARSKVAEIEAENKAACEQIISAGETAAQDEYWKLFKKGTDDAEKRKERLGSVAQLEAKKQLLAVKQELIAKAFELAIEKIDTMADADKVKFLSEIAARASHSGNEEIIFPAGTDAAFGETVVAKANELLAAAGKNGALKLSGEKREMRGGLVLREGSIEMNCGLDALVDDVRNGLTGAVASTLFD